MKKSKIFTNIAIAGVLASVNVGINHLIENNAKQLPPEMPTWVNYIPTKSDYLIDQYKQSIPKYLNSNEVGKELFATWIQHYINKNNPDRLSDFSQQAIKEYKKRNLDTTNLCIYKVVKCE